ncbi:hypothetical protein BJ138DRAFT_330279 [Hygrophoropsis aurantiaca]|uniref:Uncharacterized protein n=1 Tax=Hygrophoropsis aurantiaca TaxID=72124 RepID=A0ACB8A609_9AGAM|nr:hypothetical protein BJ138DRAFT_330279 [Hygrophoropsis aurantiaca]
MVHGIVICTCWKNTFEQKHILICAQLLPLKILSSLAVMTSRPSGRMVILNLDQSRMPSNIVYILNATNRRVSSLVAPIVSVVEQAALAKLTHAIIRLRLVNFLAQPWDDISVPLLPEILEPTHWINRLMEPAARPSCAAGVFASAWFRYSAALMLVFSLRTGGGANTLMKSSTSPLPVGFLRDIRTTHNTAPCPWRWPLITVDQGRNTMVQPH